MLRKVLLAIGALLLLGAAWFALLGQGRVALQMLVPGLMLTAGIAWERWQYKRPADGGPRPHWQNTGERFVDPGSGQLVDVYYDPRSGERHYVQAGRGQDAA
ncbi:MAG: hypothetical protein ISP90_07635 [Nevskia sp.]|nr:hypothetical protein [Nevskia sp.]